MAKRLHPARRRRTQRLAGQSHHVRERKPRGTAGRRRQTLGTTTQTTWNSKYPAHVGGVALAAREGKYIAQQSVETPVLPLVRRLRASPGVDDTERAALGITVPNQEPSPVGPTTTRPVPTVNASQRLQHTIDFTDETRPTRRAKPAGVIGAETWVNVDGPPPVAPAELTFLAVDTRASYTRLQRRAREQAGALRGALDQLARRGRDMERDGDGAVGA
ncbi:MAG: hypothetical protein JNG88_17005 [Phycisphaerales bacterium]|nr:hypothetical protein [Phycisphaerales bacterium]